MQICEQHLSLAQTGALYRLGFLDLDDHSGGGEHLFRGGQDCGPGGDVVGIRKTRADPGPRFNDDIMAMHHSLAHGIRSHADAEFLRLDLFRATDLHSFLPAGRDRPLSRENEPLPARFL